MRTGGHEGGDPVASIATTVGRAARDAVGFSDANPDEAWMAGLEFPCAELRTIIGSGACDRVSKLGVRAHQSDLGRVDRAAYLIALADRRAEERIASIEQAESSRGIGGISDVIMLGSAVIGLVGVLA